MIVQFLKKLADEIEAVSEETMKKINLTLEEPKEKEEVLGSLNKEGKQLYCLIKEAERELEEKDILAEERGNSGLVSEDILEKEYRYIDELEDRIVHLYDVLYIEINKIIENEPTPEFETRILIRRDWKIVEKIIEKELIFHFNLN